MRLQKVEKRVQNILTECEETRKNDTLLAYKFIEQVYPECGWFSFETAMYHLADKGFSFESITRARRLVQEKHPELIDTTTTEIRHEKVEEYLNYVRGE